MSYNTSTEYATKHNLLAPHLHNKIINQLGIQTIALTDSFRIKTEGPSKVIEDLNGTRFTFNDGMVRIVADCKRINEVKGDIAYTRIESTITSELFSIDCGRPIKGGTDRIIVFDIDGGNDTSKLVQELESIEAVKIVGAANRGKFSRHYITRITEAKYKELGLDGKSKFKLDKFKCDVFCGAHLIIGPSAYNEAKEQEFFISEKGIPELTMSIESIIKEELDKSKTTIQYLNIDHTTLPESQQQYIRRPYSRMCPKMGSLFAACMHKAKKMWAENGGENRKLVFIRGKGKNKGQLDLADLSHKIMDFVTRGTPYDHIDDVPPNGGYYTIINNLSIHIAADPSFIEPKFAEEVLRFVNNLGSEPLDEGVIQGIIMRMFTDKFGPDDSSYGEPGLNRWFADSDWYQNTRVFGRATTRPDGRGYWEVVISIDDNYYYLTDYVRRTITRLEKDRQEALKVAANVIGVPQTNLLGGSSVQDDPIEVRVEFIDDSRSDFGIKYDTRNNETGICQFNRRHITSLTSIMRDGYPEDPLDSDYQRKNSKGQVVSTVRNEKKYREMMNRRIPGLNKSRVPRISIRLLREVCGCYSCDPITRAEGRAAFNHICMLGLYRASQPTYDAGLILQGIFRSGKDMIVDRYITNYFEEDECVELEPEPLGRKAQSNNTYNLTKKDIQRTGEFNNYVSYKFLKFSDLLDGSIPSHIVIGFLKSLTGIKTANLREMYRAPVSIAVDLLLVGTSNSIISVEKGMERISIIPILTRGKFVKLGTRDKKWGEGKTVPIPVAEKKGKLRDVPFISKLRFVVGIGPLPDDETAKKEYTFDVSELNDDLNRICPPDEDSIEGTIVRDSVAAGHWVRYESEMFWSWVHKRFTTNPKYMNMYKNFVPTIPIQNRALKKSQEMSNVSGLVANEVRAGDAESLSKRLYEGGARIGTFQELRNPARPGDTNRVGINVYWFGENGDRLYIDTLAWAINAKSGLQDTKDKNYISSHSVYRSIQYVGVEIKLEKGLMFVEIPGIKEALNRRLPPEGADDKVNDIVF